MDFLMDMLRAIESIRNPVFDFLFSLITHLGEETVFLALAICIFWCVDKRSGYFVLITGLFGTVANQAAKLIFRIPRPWIIDPSFNVVDSAIEEATGYSFPSGHTQNIAGTFGSIAAYNSKRRPLVIGCLVIIFLVAFSRMYLGVHTLLDVGVSLLFAAFLVILLRPVFVCEKYFDLLMPFVSVLGLLIALAHFIFVNAISSDPTLDPQNLASGIKNSATLLGATAGLIPVYFFDRYYLKFDTRAPWYSQIIKLVVGLGVVLIIKSALSAPLTALFGNETFARAVRYFLIVIFAGVVWPLSFRPLSELKIGALDRFGDKVASFFRKGRVA